MRMLACYWSLLVLLFNLCFLPKYTAYYLSSERLDWQSAASYCQQRCNSQLAGIRSDTDHNNTIQLITKTYERFNFVPYTIVSNTLPQNKSVTTRLQHVWIGLLRANEIAFRWSDEPSEKLYEFNYTLFNPWRHLAPGAYNATKECVILRSDRVQYRFDEYKCSEARLFLCNSCDGVINKYSSSTSSPTNFTDAETYCNDVYQTNLATIHGVDDMHDVAAFTNRSARPQFFIGLYDTKQPNHNYTWIDNTSFVFGSDVTGGVYPWEATEPGNGPNRDCVRFRDAADRWADTECSSTLLTICNRPSEFCDEAQWLVVDGGDPGDWQWKKKPCGVDVNAVGSNTRQSAVIKDKTWTNMAKNLAIDYMYKATTSFNLLGYTGVTLWFNESDCDQNIFFGVNTMTSSSQYIYNARCIIDDILIEESTEPFILPPMNLQLNTDYTLQVRQDTNIAGYTLSIQNLPSSTCILKPFEDGTRCLQHIWNSTASGYVGILAANSRVLARSLFISGSITFYNETNTESVKDRSFCSVAATSKTPTTIPSEPPNTLNNTTTAPANTTEESNYTPTTFATGYPTAAPTISYGVRIQIFLSYRVEIVNESNSTVWVPEWMWDFLRITTWNLTVREVNQQGLEQCANTDAMIINVTLVKDGINDTFSWNIIAIVWVCDERAEQTLSGAVNNELRAKAASEKLEGDVIDKMQENGYLVADTQVRLEAERITKSMTTTTMTSTEQMISTTMRTDELEPVEPAAPPAWMVIFSVFGTVIICCVCILCIMIAIRLRKDKQQQKTDEVELMQSKKKKKVVYVHEDGKEDEDYGDDTEAQPGSPASDAHLIGDDESIIAKTVTLSPEDSEGGGVTTRGDPNDVDHDVVTPGDTQRADEVDHAHVTNGVDDEMEVAETAGRADSEFVVDGD